MNHSIQMDMAYNYKVQSFFAVRTREGDATKEIERYVAVLMLKISTVMLQMCRSKGRSCVCSSLS